MNRILKTPLIPVGKVKSAAVSGEYKDIIKGLNILGIDCFEIDNSNNLHSSISSHADCRIIQLSDNIFICDENIILSFKKYIENNTKNIVKILTNRAEATKLFLNEFTENYIYLLPEKVVSPYPADVKLNAKVIGNTIICNQKYISDLILDFAKNNNYRILHTNQGYSACSSLLVNSDEIITDDISIYNAVHRMEIYSTILRKGEIKLKDCNYGFIGGCCGFIDSNIIAFTGKLNSLSDCNIIKDVLKRNNIEYIELTDKTMFDIGGIIPLIEEI